MSPPPARLPIRRLLAAGAVAAALGGCGLAPGSGEHGATILVTRDFGSHPIGQTTIRNVSGAPTVLELLRRGFRVQTGRGGTGVTSINGAGGGASGGDWSYFINGIAAQRRAGRAIVHPGDQVWWDRHDQSATTSVPAVVGQFPEPFTSGTGGRRLPTVLSCAGDVGAACAAVGKALSAARVPYASQALGTGSGSDSLAIVVGTWSEVSGVIASDLLAAGPAKSGVYAQFVGSAGQVLELENPKGQVVRTVRGDVGLIAATEQPSLNQPTWLVTGATAAGVTAAARALTPARLRHHFALAVVDGTDLPLPLDAGA